MTIAVDWDVKNQTKPSYLFQMIIMLNLLIYILNGSLYELMACNKKSPQRMLFPYPYIRPMHVTQILLYVTQI